MLLKLLIIICSIALTNTVIAGQRALLIGVGTYQIPNKDLPGIDVDLELMKNSLIRMGFSQEEMHFLLNEDATFKNIKHEITTWLTNDVSVDDRVVLYFGGHGSRIRDENGDEQDGVDEVLLTYNSKVIRKNNGNTLSNVIVDDDLAKWITNIPSNNVLVLIDACNSGTVTRSTKFTLQSLKAREGVYKFFYYEGIPTGDGSSFARSLRDHIALQNSNYIALSATQDNGLALTTDDGSFFTLGIVKSINNAASANLMLTVEDMYEEARHYIQTKISPDLLYHPQIYGNEELAKGKFKLFVSDN